MRRIGILWGGAVGTLIVVAVATMLGASDPNLQQASSAPTAAVRIHRYKVLEYTKDPIAYAPENLERRLNEEGRNGWHVSEIVTVPTTPAEGYFENKRVLVILESP